MRNISIKNKNDLEKVFGAKVSKLVLKTLRKSFMKRLPFSVTLTSEKPRFYLDDGGMLRVYAINMSTGEVLSEKYGGSADSITMHLKEQLAEGQKAPGEVAVFFVETSPSSGNHPWSITVISNYLVSQIENKSPEITA